MPATPRRPFATGHSPCGLGFRPQPSCDGHRGAGAGELRNDERHDTGRRDAGERVRQRTRQRHRRVGERGRSGEPIGRGDVEADRVRHRRRLRTRGSRRSSAAGRRWRPLRRTIAPVRCGSSSRTARPGARTSDARPRRRQWRRQSARRHSRRRPARAVRRARRRPAVTAGLKCAPETGPNIRISTTRMAPVGSVLHRSASAPLPPASFAAMMPEPTTAASRNAVPSASAARRRPKSGVIDPSPWRSRRPCGRCPSGVPPASGRRATGSAARRKSRCGGSASGRRR